MWWRFRASLRADGGDQTWLDGGGVGRPRAGTAARIRRDLRLCEGLEKGSEHMGATYRMRQEAADRSRSGALEGESAGGGVSEDNNKRKCANAPTRERLEHIPSLALRGKLAGLGSYVTEPEYRPEGEEGTYRMLNPFATRGEKPRRRNAIARAAQSDLEGKGAIRLRELVNRVDSPRARQERACRISTHEDGAAGSRQNEGGKGGRGGEDGARATGQEVNWVPSAEEGKAKNGREEVARSGLDPSSIDTGSVGRSVPAEESSLFGLQKWLAPAPIGLFRAWAWILVASHAHARHFGLQAILSAWQATLTKGPSIGFYVANTLVYVPWGYLGHQLSHNFNILFVTMKNDDGNSYPTWKPAGLFLHTKTLDTPEVLDRPQSNDMPGNHYFPLATKWLAQAILSDAIKMGVGTACYEKLRDSCHNKINAISVISNLPAPSMLQ
ncbi:hypothetical protein DFH09DRAFT_1457259 [Mycena vulgaris]|nr:hypothetical protein DFH09DRAFT_1457259 [Mycena vulgaris]